MHASAEKQHVVLDLDGTIVFPEAAEIAIPGRSRPTFVSRATADALQALSAGCHLTIATARSAQSVRGMLEQLPDLHLFGLVSECGLVARTNDRPSSSQVAEPRRDALVQRVQSSFPNWQVIDGYETIVGCISGLDPQEAHTQASECIRASEFASWIVHQERHKTFFYPTRPDKLAGLRSINIEGIEIAAGDDATYDISMLEEATLPMAPDSADASVRKLVISRRGYVAPGTSHAAAQNLLGAIDHYISLRGRIA